MNANGQCSNRYCNQCRNMPMPGTVTPFAEELARELRKAAAIRRNPFAHIPAALKTSKSNIGEVKHFAKDWLKSEPRVTLAGASKALAWTSQPVTDADDNTYPNHTAWLTARREALGLSNDISAPEPQTAPEPVQGPPDMRAAVYAAIMDASESLALPPAPYERPRCQESTNLTQADYAALLSMTGDMFAGREPYGWSEPGRNALLVHLAPSLMGSGISPEALHDAVADMAHTRVA